MFSAFLTVFLSLTIEALPFLVLGTLIATAVQKFQAFTWLLSKLPNNKILRRFCFAFLGIAMPVCECGNVPLARGFMQKGFSTKEATTFLLAAPILNPITFITTREAFRTVEWMLPARMIGGLIIALIVGHIIGSLRSPLTEQFVAKCNPLSPEKKARFSLFFAREFWALLKLLIIGAIIAASVQTFTTQQLFAQVGSNYLVGVLVFLLLSFIVAICANVDAFFALSFAGSVRYGALLTFLVAGPMVDIKILSMLSKTYRKKALLLMTMLVAIFSIILGWSFSYVG